jgi:hypothetical protein
MQYKKVRIFGRYEHGDEQNNDQLIKLYLDEVKCYGEQTQNESVREKEGVFVIDEKGDVFELKRFINMKNEMPDELFEGVKHDLHLKSVTAYEIYETNDDGMHAKTISIHSSKVLHEIDYENEKNGYVKETKRSDCYLDENKNFYEVKKLGIDASIGRSEKEEFRQSLIKTLTPEQLEYLKENPL